jgi:hypothetical protein
MPIQENSVVVGCCYETSKNQQRRVTQIVDGNVTYESWGGNVQNTKSPLPRTTVNLKKFAEDVDKAIACPASLADDDAPDDPAD